MKTLVLILCALAALSPVVAILCFLPRMARLLRSHRRVGRACEAVVRADMAAITAVSRGNLLALESAIEQREAARAVLMREVSR